MDDGRLHRCVRRPEEAQRKRLGRRLRPALAPPVEERRRHEPDRVQLRVLFGDRGVPGGDLVRERGARQQGGRLAMVPQEGRLRALRSPGLDAVQLPDEGRPGRGGARPLLIHQEQGQAGQLGGGVGRQGLSQVHVRLKDGGQRDEQALRDRQGHVARGEVGRGDGDVQGAALPDDFLEGDLLGRGAGGLIGGEGERAWVRGEVDVGSGRGQGRAGRESGPPAWVGSLSLSSSLSALALPLPLAH